MSFLWACLDHVRLKTDFGCTTLLKDTEVFYYILSANKCECIKKLCSAVTFLTVLFGKTCWQICQLSKKFWWLLSPVKRNRKLNRALIVCARFVFPLSFFCNHKQIYYRFVALWVMFFKQNVERCSRLETTSEW